MNVYQRECVVGQVDGIACQPLLPWSRLVCTLAFAVALVLSFAGIARLINVFLLLHHCLSVTPLIELAMAAAACHGHCQLLSCEQG